MSAITSTISLRDLTALDPTQVANNMTQTEDQLLESNPNLLLYRDVLRSLLVYYHALLATAQQQNVNDYLNARSLLVMMQNPTLAPAEFVDEALSNFLVTRQPGGQAAGEV